MKSDTRFFILPCAVLYTAHHPFTRLRTASIKVGICFFIIFFLGSGGGGGGIEYPASSRGGTGGRGLFIFLSESADASVLSQPRQQQIVFRFVQQTSAELRCFSYLLEGFCLAKHELGTMGTRW